MYLSKDKATVNILNELINSLDTEKKKLIKNGTDFLI